MEKTQLNQFPGETKQVKLKLITQNENNSWNDTLY